MICPDLPRTTHFPLDDGRWETAGAINAWEAGKLFHIDRNDEMPGR